MKIGAKSVSVSLARAMRRPFIEGRPGPIGAMGNGLVRRDRLCTSRARRTFSMVCAGQDIGARTWLPTRHEVGQRSKGVTGKAAWGAGE
jgi:hypothetical protein